VFALPLLATLAIVPTARAVDHSWDTEDGLPQSSVTAVAQGSDGLLQVGTFGGLARFDGAAFEVWSSSTSEGWSTIRITELGMSEADTLWVGLQDGSVVRIAPDGTEQVLPESPLSGGAVWDLEVDGESIWIAGSRGVAKWDGEWTAIPDTLDAHAVVRTDEATWVGSEFGLLRCDPSCERVELEGVEIVHALATESDAVLVGGPHGLVRLRGDAVESIEKRPVHFVASGGKGDVWYGSETWVRSHTADLSLDLETEIRRLFVDREGNLWVGTDADGLVRVTREDWSVLPVRDGVLPMVERPDGTVWAGRGCGANGIVEVPGGETINVVEGCVRAMAAGTDGELWLGVEGDVWTWDEVHGATLQANIHERVLALLPDDEGVWVGTDGAGAFLLRNGTATPVDVLDDRVLVIEKGRGDEIWFGTHGGISRMTGGGVIERWSRADGAPKGAVRAIRSLDDGTVLFGSYGGGLGVFRDGTMTQLTRADGLRDEVISAIVLDDAGGIWLNGNRGVSHLTRRTLEDRLNHPEEQLRVRRWSTPEGNGGGSPAGIRTDDGVLLFATVEGVALLDPTSIFDEEPPTPQVVLQHAVVDGIPLVPGTLVQVPAGPGRVEIAFTANALSRPELALLQVRKFVDGQAEGGWQPLGEDRRLVWESLEPGLHRVELRVVNEQDDFSESLRLEFELAAAWYQHPSTWVAAGLSLLLLGFSAHRWRTRVVQRRNASLVREIQQREVAEKALRVSEAHYRRVFHGASDALFVIGPNRVVREANPAAETMLGRNAVLSDFDALFGPESADHGARPVLDAAKETWVALRELPFEDDRTLARAVDVTERVAAEAERRQLTRRLAAAERMEAVGRLAGGIAHDFNNLLTALGGGVELLARRSSKADEDLLDGLGACVDRGAKLTRQLLSFARRQHLEPDRIDPSKLLDGVEAILRPSLRDDISLSVEHPPLRVGIDVDASQLELAIINLVLNAQDATPSGGRIKIRVRRDAEDAVAQRWPGRLPARSDGWVTIEVEDTGRGIPKEDLERVLEPFYTTRPDGTGLGLPSVVGFAEQSGGTLCITSEPERGTTASIVLPWVEPPFVELVAVHAPRTEGVTGRVVVCDDDDMVREVIEAMLQRAGHETAAYGNPLDLLAAFDERFECDVLVTDVLMPEMTGPELAKRLLRRRPDLRIIFMSGYTEDQAGRDLPGPLLSKPLRSAVLLEAVALTLGRAGSSGEIVRRSGA